MNEVVGVGCVKELMGALAMTGVSNEQLEKWYDAVYVSPDVAYVKNLLEYRMQDVLLDDVRRLADAFDRDVMYGINKTKEWCWSLLGMSEINPEVITYEKWVVSHLEEDNILEEGSMMAYYYQIGDDGTLSESCFLIDPAQFKERSRADLLLAVEHESVHGLQAKILSEAIQAGVSNALDLTRDPTDVQRSSLYALNSAFQVDPNIEGYDAYANQILEKEAFLAMEIMRERIQALIMKNGAEDVAEKLNYIL